jgi:hypothetical protein
MTDYFDPYAQDQQDPYAAADPYGLGFGQGYTTQPDQQSAMLNYLLSLDKKGLAQMRSALTGVGTDLTNQGKVLGMQNKMYDNESDLTKLAMNPAIGQMSGAFDPMALEQQMQGQQTPPPFGATDFSPLREQWNTSQTPAASAVLAMFDQIDQGQDPSTLVSQFTQNTGGSLDIPDKQTGLTGKQLLAYGGAYWNEATQRRAAQAQFGYKQQTTQGQVPGMEGVDPTLGSFTEPYVSPAIGDTLVANQMAEQDAAMQARPQISDLAGVTASGATNMHMPAAPVYESGSAQRPNFLGELLNSAKSGSDWVNKKIGGAPADDQSLFFPKGSDTSRRVSGSPQGGGVKEAMARFLGTVNKAAGGSGSTKPKPKPKYNDPSPQDRQASQTHVTGRLSALEDSERKRLGLQPRSTGQSVGQRNLQARIQYLGGHPYPG